MTTFETVTVFVFGLLVLVGLPVLFFLAERIGTGNDAPQEKSEWTTRERVIGIGTFSALFVVFVLVKSRSRESGLIDAMWMGICATYFWGLIFYAVQKERCMRGQPPNALRAARTATFALIGLGVFVLIIGGVLFAMNLGPENGRG